MDLGLKGKAAVVTGASVGIGLRTVEELADFFVFLCSDRASYSVGATCHVDGGMLKGV
jgi:NAD(P)-dependent dehydrogenase (short-subunit alcohol dehydrogenase family)